MNTKPNASVALYDGLFTERYVAEHTPIGWLVRDRRTDRFVTQYALHEEQARKLAKDWNDKEASKRKGAA